jgi:hypothetical protein
MICPLKSIGITGLAGLWAGGQTKNGIFYKRDYKIVCSATPAPHVPHQKLKILGYTLKFPAHLPTESPIYILFYRIKYIYIAPMPLSKPLEHDHSFYCNRVNI